jgi:hypothetical protein
MRMHVDRLKNHREKGFATGYKWVPTHDQLADALTKSKITPFSIRKVLKSGFLKRPE